MIFHQQLGVGGQAFALYVQTRSAAVTWPSGPRPGWLPQADDAVLEAAWVQRQQAGELAGYLVDHHRGGATGCRCLGRNVDALQIACAPVRGQALAAPQTASSVTATPMTRISTVVSMLVAWVMANCS